MAFHRSVSKHNRIKNKNKQMGPNQMYKLLNSKGNHKQNKKGNLWTGRNVSKWCNRQELNFQNIQELIQFNNNNRKQLKNGQKTYIRIFPKKT